MNLHSFDLDRLSNPLVADYLNVADSRIVSGFRFAMEVLDIPLPEYAKRKPAGRSSIAKLMAAADADSGTIYKYRDEKLKIGAFATLK